MKNLLSQLRDDEAGFVISAELVIISTLLVIGLIVGMAEVANGVNAELEDVGSAVGSMNQSYHVSGAKGHKAWKLGSHFSDSPDYCDAEGDIRCDSPVYPESPRGYGYGY